MPLPTAPIPDSSPRREGKPSAAVTEDVAMPDLTSEESTGTRSETVKARAPRRQPQRKPRRNAPRRDPLDRRDSQEDYVPEGWVRDKKTNVLHKYIPRTEMDEDNMPVLHLDDLNLDDLTGEAEKYLAHLRVPPNKEERQRLLEEKAERTRAQNRAYTQANPEEQDADDE